ncbi:restriction endonuclease subunit S (plasmid) [Escherichia coli]|uniref:restriction endonuclease subunit S n=1 Tax=Escherichia coli TaxID=562 RepID=UPI002307778B|nr:restriction endonuclease subunit S [Escherichia coli]WCE51567.1 restriction endonuclease subunit S [Escherichia coli]
MSELSYLEKLLDGVEVEWKTLGSIAELKRGTSITKKDVIDGTIPVVAGGRTPAYYHNTSNRDGQTIVIAGSGAYAGFVSWWEEPIFVSDAFTVKPHNILLPRYCYHFLMNMQQQLHDFKSGGGVPHVYPRDVSPILIPIPCPDNPEKSLAIQSEIVRILDKFSALTAELTAELNMRKKQYNYYRDQLLSFKEGEVEWKTLGEIGNFTYGYAAKAMDSGDARFVRITDINKDGKLSKENPMYVELNEENEKYTLDKNDLLMARTGATFGKTMIFEEDYPAVYAGFLIKLNLNETTINAKYYWHFAQSDFFWEQANKLVSGGGQPQFNANALKQVRVPIPYPSHPQKSLDEQGRIVDILDKFDAIAASITEGLPREIELRQKQYEYYRDLLFSFPKPETVSN